MELIFVVAYIALTIVPLFKLLPRFGIHPVWSFAVVIPFGLIVLLWIMASRLDRPEGGR